MADVPALVVCANCGAVYDYNALHRCPVCRKTEHRSLWVLFNLGSKMMEVVEQG